MRVLLRFSTVLLFASLCVQAQFRWNDAGGKSLELTEGGKPVFVYNYRTMLRDGVPADRARCCYVHPLYAPNGIALTDDFPKDHYHHRGVNWMWPIVNVDGKSYDLWTIRGIHARFGRWLGRSSEKDRATIGVENNWYVGDTIEDGTAAVREQVTIQAHAVKDGSRDIDFTVRLRALRPGVSIAGTQEGGKGYGGFNIRFAPRKGTKIETEDGPDVPDSDLKPQPWAQLNGEYGGKSAAARITIDKSNPGFPNGWCLRHYGFLGVDYPGLTPVDLPTDKDLVLRYRVTVTGM